MLTAAGLSDNHDVTSTEELDHTSTAESISQTGCASSQQNVAGTAPNGQARAPVRNNKRARTVRERRRNPPHLRGHIPRPRNSRIIYRSDKTRELRDMDPSLTASDICKTSCLSTLQILADDCSAYHLPSLG
jgi:hypothetical protein